MVAVTETVRIMATFLIKKRTWPGHRLVATLRGARWPGNQHTVNGRNKVMHQAHAHHSVPQSQRPSAKNIVCVEILRCCIAGEGGGVDVLVF